MERPGSREALEDAAEAASREAVAGLLAEACRRVCPTLLLILGGDLGEARGSGEVATGNVDVGGAEEPESPPSGGSGGGPGRDRAVALRFLRRARRRHKSSAAHDMEWVAPRAFCQRPGTAWVGRAGALAEALAEAVGDSALRCVSADDTAVAWCRAETRRGALHITTRLEFERRRAGGFLFCADCGHFVRGHKGMREHAQVVHRRPYLEANLEAAAAASGGQIVPFAADGTPMAALRGLWEEAERERREALGTVPRACEAARRGDVAGLRALLAGPEGDTALAARDRHEASALHWAAGGGHLAVCELLVGELGWDPGQKQGKFGRSPMHWACRNGRLTAARYLAACGADPDARTGADGTTPLHLAVWQGQRQVVAWLLDECGCDLHALNAFGCNASQWAAQSGDVGMCRFLQRRGLDLGVLNRNGHSAVHKAAVKGRAEVCRWLLGSAGLGAAHLAADADGNTPARMAALEGHPALAAWLQAASAALAPDPSQLTPSQGPRRGGGRNAPH